jgi:D-arabinose 1-dehydrogenase-like Zn-dependent alcohol dehydrogenase
MTSEAQSAAVVGDSKRSATAVSTMQAVVQDTYGSADVLRLAQIPQPEIADNELLVRVRAAGVHIGDEHSMTGQPYLMRVMGFGLRAPKARVRGTDVAGVVEAVGTNVSRFKVGDQVLGTCAGAFAEHATSREDKLAASARAVTVRQPAVRHDHGESEIGGFAAPEGAHRGGQGDSGHRRDVSAQRGP